MKTIKLIYKEKLTRELTIEELVETLELSGLAYTLTRRQLVVSGPSDTLVITVSRENSK